MSSTVIQAPFFQDTLSLNAPSPPARHPWAISLTLSKKVVLPNSNPFSHLSFVEVAFDLGLKDVKSLPAGWVRWATFSITVLNSVNPARSLRFDSREMRRFDTGGARHCAGKISLDELAYLHKGFIRDGQLTISVSVHS